jgi:hypothetical protein
VHSDDALGACNGMGCEGDSQIPVLEDLSGAGRPVRCRKTYSRGRGSCYDSIARDEFPGLGPPVWAPLYLGRDPVEAIETRDLGKTVQCRELGLSESMSITNASIRPRFRILK